METLFVDNTVDSCALFLIMFEGKVKTVIRM